jgi:tetratricopeptide (TPR) repeat protein
LEFKSNLFLGQWATVAEARGFFGRALIADPNNIDALIGSAAADAIAGALVFVPYPVAAFAEAEAKLSKVLSSAPDHARAHMYPGLVEMWTKRGARGIAECEHALTRDRNFASAYHFIGIGKILIARAEETEAHIQEALRLSPRTRAPT